MAKHGTESYSEGRIVIEPLLTINDVCRLLSISKQTLYRLLGDGQLPSTRVRGHLRFSPDDIREFLERSRETGDLGALLLPDG
jgi:excisionase family DNA binding protein